MADAVVVITDLNGTLFPGWDDAAAPVAALQRLDQLGIPMIIASSRSLNDIAAVRARLGVDHPFIFENGAGVALPGGCAGRAGRGSDDLEVELFADDYLDIVRTLYGLREQFGYRFQGYLDCTPKRLGERLGIDARIACRARQRIASEVIVWQDSPEARDEFAMRLGDFGLTMVRSDGDWMISRRRDKSEAVEWLLDRYRAEGRFGGVRPVVIGCGNDPDDVAMLSRADVALVFPRSDGLDLAVRPRCSMQRVIDVGGWGDAVLRLLVTADTPRLQPRLAANEA